MIAAIIPRVAVGNSGPIIFPSDEGPAAVAALYANLNSFVLDYVARQKVGGTNLNYFIIKQLPVLPPDTYEAHATWQPNETLQNWIAKRVLELSYTAWDLQPFAADLGYDGPPFHWDVETPLRTAMRVGRGLLPPLRDHSGRSRVHHVHVPDRRAQGNAGPRQLPIAGSDSGAVRCDGQRQMAVDVGSATI